MITNHSTQDRRDETAVLGKTDLNQNENININKENESQLFSVQRKPIHVTYQDAFVFGNIFIQRILLTKCIKILLEIMETCDLKAETGNQTLSDKEIESNIEFCILTLNSFNLHFFEDYEQVEKIYIQSSSKTDLTHESLYCDMSRAIKTLVDSNKKDVNIYEEYEQEQREIYTCMFANNQARQDISNDHRVSKVSSLVVVDLPYNNLSEMIADDPSTHVYESISSSFERKCDERKSSNNQNEGLLCTSLSDDSHYMKGTTNVWRQTLFTGNLASQHSKLHMEIDKIAHLEKEESVFIKVSKWLLSNEIYGLMLDYEVSEGFIEELLYDHLDLISDASSTHFYESISSSYERHSEERESSTSLSDESEFILGNTDIWCQKLFFGNLASQNSVLHKEIEKIAHLEQEESIFMKVANWLLSPENDWLNLDDEFLESSVKELHYDFPDIISDAASTHVYESISSSYMRQNEKRESSIHQNQALLCTSPSDASQDVTSASDVSLQNLFLGDLKNKHPTFHKELEEIAHLEKEESVLMRVSKWISCIESNMALLDDEFLESSCEGHTTLSLSNWRNCSTRSIGTTPLLPRMFFGESPIYQPELLLVLHHCRFSDPVWV